MIVNDFDGIREAIHRLHNPGERTPQEIGDDFFALVRAANKSAIIKAFAPGDTIDVPLANPSDAHGLPSWTKPPKHGPKITSNRLIVAEDDLIEHMAQASYRHDYPERDHPNGASWTDLAKSDDETDREFCDIYRAESRAAIDAINTFNR